MEYIMISEDKLKVILSEQELSAWNISAEELDYQSPSSRSVFERLLSYAKEEFGFDTSDRRLLIQLFGAKDGSCELFFTRLGSISDEENKEKNNVRRKKKSDAPHTKIFSFDDLGALLALCRRLYLAGYSGRSSVWLDIEKRWFLTLNSDDDGDSKENRLFDILGEYGNEENRRSASLYLGEYGDELYKNNAVSLLGKI